MTFSDHPDRARGSLPPDALSASPDGSVSAFYSGNTSALRALQTIVEPGTNIDGFEVRRLLGRGSLAAVYDGVHLDSGTEIAIKILDARLMADKAMLARFHAEGEALAAFNHPNIVGHIAHGRDDVFAYIAMELVRGITLDQLIYTITLEPHHFVHIAHELSKGLTTIHSQGVFHGDVKPSNILVTREGDVKLTDFGTAGGPIAARRTTTKVSGTPAYMAPELFDKLKAVDYRADIYSLGVTFYKMFTGKLPGDDPDDVATVRPDLPAGLDAVLSRAMDDDPDRRYTTAKELCDTIAGMFDKDAVVTPVSSAVTPTDAPGAAVARSFGSAPAPGKEAGKSTPGGGIDWKLIIVCALAAIGLAATMLVLAVMYGKW